MIQRQTICAPTKFAKMVNVLVGTYIVLVQICKLSTKNKFYYTELFSGCVEDKDCNEGNKCLDQMCVG